MILIIIIAWSAAVHALSIRLTHSSSRHVCPQLAPSSPPTRHHGGLARPTDCTSDENNNILAAYEKCGVNPFVVPVVVDYFKESPKFSTWRLNESMTLTHTRCGGFGYWCSTKGAPLDVSDLCRLQGFHPDDLPYKEADVTDTSMSQVLGNGQTFLICLAILPHLLYHASLITLQEFVAMKVASENYSPLQR